MITFVINNNSQKLKDAARLAQNFFKQLNLLDLPYSFTHTDLRTEEVYGEIIEAAVCLPDRFVIVETYRPKWRFSKAIGYTTASKPNYIFVNEYRLARLDAADYAGNFTHEFMHLIGFKHKGNNPSKFRNLESVPYVLGAMAEAWVRAIEYAPSEQIDLPIEPAILAYE